MNTPNLEWTRELLIWCSPSIPFKSSNGTRLSQAKDPTWSLSDFKQSAVTQPTLLDRSHPGISYQLTPLLSGKRHTVPGRMHAEFQVLCQPLISTLKDAEEPTGHRNVTGQTLQHPAGYRLERAELWFPRQRWQGDCRLFPFSLFAAEWVTGKQEIIKHQGLLKCHVQGQENRAIQSLEMNWPSQNTPLSKTPSGTGFVTEKWLTFKASLL